MLICMRTTLVIEDRLLAAAKREAATRGITLSALVSDALREALRAIPPAVAPRFEMVTFAPRSKIVRHEPADFADALAAEDRERFER